MLRSIALTLLIAYVPAYASNVSVVAGGALNTVVDPNALLPFTAVRGEHVALTFSYDSEAPDRLGSDPVIGVYQGITGMTLVIGGSTLPGFAISAIVVFNDLPTGARALDLWSADTYLDAPAHRTRIFLQIDSSCFGSICNDGVQSDALVPPPLEWAQRAGRITYLMEDRQNPQNPITLAQASASVDFIQVTESISEVPLPGSSWLLGTGLSVLGWGRRKAIA